MSVSKRANTGARHLSGYQILWILVTFDLPVETKAQRKAATQFRQHLLDLGFEMSQFSNYMRFCKGKEQFETYVNRIEAALPEWGNIYIYQFTDRQYENIIRFCDQSRKRQKKNPNQLALF
ncbi:CRISPR-associated endonuclease Cas2 [Woodsholea maritima]|uniref:CRISPR-associated endonuclease Cas2 n=1 Tax=Woodsholea maritima TaxID=240237 RepID=UPI0003612448|nr:CRISPR-associated endonuclease Cas2 [Woodsholea maritima]